MPVVIQYNKAAIVLSISALSFTPVVLLFFRHYYRALDFLQMCYLFALLMANTTFSSHLTTAMLDFNQTFFSSCTSGDYICSNGFRLSFGAVLLAILGVTFIFVLLQKCCNKTIQYEPVYNCLKGFIKWIYLPLIYSSTVFVLIEVNKSTMDVMQLIAPAVILAGLAAFPFFQLIGYKCIQKDDTPAARKWMEWWMYMRLLSTGVLCALFYYYNEKKYQNCVFIVLGVYSVLYLIFGQFRYKLMERVIFFLGDAAFITLYFIFTYNPQYIFDYDLDLFGLAAVMLVDAFLYVIRGIRMYCSGPHEGVANDGSVNPELNDERKPKYSNNKYDVADQLQNSREDLNDNPSARGPNRGAARRRR